ncbi:MAG TPA: hypothetical protein VGK88_03730 [bacterium]|jgi:hypothetical protein
MNRLLIGLLVPMLVLAIAAPGAARIGDPVAGFMSGPLAQQLQLNPQAQTSLSGPLSGRILHRFVSDDGAIVVDLIVFGGAIEQEVMYAPLAMNRGVQVSFFLQDAVGSVFGAQKGMLAFRAAVINRKETYLTFGGLIMRFVPMGGGRLRVQVSR